MIDIPNKADPDHERLHRKQGGLSKYSRMTPAKKPEIHVTHTCLSLKWMTEQ